MSTERFYRLP